MILKTIMNLHGIFPPLPTPFAPSGALDLSGLTRNIERLSLERVTGFVVGGSNGEFTSLTVEERLQVIATARSVIDPDQRLIAGTGMESTSATIALTRAAAEAGAEAALVVTPGYFKGRMTAEALTAHFLAVADASPLPIILYSVPANTGVDLPVEAVVALSRHPQIIGLKDSGGDITKFGRLKLECEPDFQLLAGSAGFLLAALAVGAVGGIMALANITAVPLAKIQERLLAGDLAQARAIQLPLIPVNTAVTARYGVAGLKAALDLLGGTGGHPRLPLLPLKAEEQADLRRILANARLLKANEP